MGKRTPREKSFFSIEGSPFMVAVTHAEDPPPGRNQANGAV